MSGYACDSCRHHNGEVPRHKYTTMDGSEYTIALDYVQCGSRGGAVVAKRTECESFKPGKRKGAAL